MFKFLSPDGFIWFYLGVTEQICFICKELENHVSSSFYFKIISYFVLIVKWKNGKGLRGVETST